MSANAEASYFMTINNKDRQSVGRVKVFVINLARRTDRLAEITAELAPLGIEFERVVAVDGQDFESPHQYQGLLSWFFNGFCYMLPGMIASSLSHQKVWQKIVDEKMPAAIVLEDDAMVADFDPRIFAVDLDEAGLDLLRIEVLDYERHLKAGTLLDREKPLIGRKTYHPVGREYGTCAYLVSYAGAKKLLKVRRPWFHVDHLGVWSFVVDLRHAILESPMFRQSGSVSSIMASNGSSKHRVPWVGRKIRRYILWPLIYSYETARFRKSRKT